MASPEHERLLHDFYPKFPPADSTLTASRLATDAMGNAFPIANDVLIEPVTIGSMYGEWVRIQGTVAKRRILYVHGGGYVVGSCASHREFVSRIARALLAEVLIFEYRLAPEYQFPMANDDAISAWQYLLSHTSEKPTYIIGDSAGGGLALSTVVRLRDEKAVLPQALVCISGWFDVAVMSESAKANDSDDPLCSVVGLQTAGQSYAGDQLQHPYVSPVYANMYKLPPVLLVVGSREVLFEDTLRVRGAIRAIGGKVEEHIYEGLTHTFPIYGVDLPETAEFFKKLVGFIEQNEA